MAYVFKHQQTLSTEVEHLDSSTTVSITDLSPLCPENDDWKSFQMVVVNKSDEIGLKAYRHIYYRIDGVDYLLTPEKELYAVGQN
jgi:hypothetical protein